MMGVYDLRFHVGSTEEVWFPNFELEGQRFRFRSLREVVAILIHQELLYANPRDDGRAGLSCTLYTAVSAVFHGIADPQHSFSTDCLEV